MSGSPARWAVPPLPDHPTRAEWARHGEQVTYNRHQIRWIWNEVCSGLRLARRVVPTGTTAFEPPPIGQIDLGPPTVFSVRLRPGQLLDDFRSHSDRLAAAYEVPDVVVGALAPGWMVVQLVDDVPRRDRDERPDLRLHGSSNAPRAGAGYTRRRSAATSANPLGRRRARGPLGGPRRLR